jgi:hypothetical protein
LLGGQYLDTEWVTTTGYYTGHFNSYATVDAFHDFQVPFEKMFYGYRHDSQVNLSQGLRLVAMSKRQDYRELVHG